MLRGREIDRQRKREDTLHEDEQRRVQMRQMLEEQRLVDNAKQAEFDRHRRVAEMEARSAALKGENTAPGGYFNPAVQEMSRVAFGAGGVEREAQDYARGVKAQEMGQKAWEEQGRNTRGRIDAMAGTINSRNVQKSEEDFRRYGEEVNLPGLSQTPFGAYFSPRDGGRSGGPPTLEDLAKRYSDSAGKVQTDFDDAGGPWTLRRAQAAEFLTNLYLRGTDNETGLREFAKRYPDLAQQEGLSAEPEAQSLTPQERARLKELAKGGGQ